MTPHTSNTRPVPPDALVLVDLGDGAPLVDTAGALAWGPGLGPDGEGRIVAYRVLTNADDTTPPTPTPTPAPAVRAKGNAPHRQRRPAARRIHVFPVPALWPPSA